MILSADGLANLPSRNQALLRVERRPVLDVGSEMEQRTSYIGKGHELIAIMDAWPERKFLLVPLDDVGSPEPIVEQTPEEAERRIADRFGRASFPELLPHEDN